MDPKEVIRDYLSALEKGNYKEMMKLFSDDAIVFSPLYGKINANAFYKDLFKDTSKSKITLINIFSSGNANVWAGNFRYDWEIKSGETTSFECVDIFKFSDEGKIEELRIIYDTAGIRNSFNTMKS